VRRVAGETSTAPPVAASTEFAFSRDGRARPRTNPPRSIPPTRAALALGYAAPLAKPGAAAPPL